MRPQSPPPQLTHFLPQGHIYSSKAMPPNSATPFRSHFLLNYHNMHLTGHTESEAGNLQILGMILITAPKERQKHCFEVNVPGIEGNDQV